MAGNFIPNHCGPYWGGVTVDPLYEDELPYYSRLHECEDGKPINRIKPELIIENFVGKYYRRLENVDAR